MKQAMQWPGAWRACSRAQYLLAVFSLDKGVVQVPVLLLKGVPWTGKGPGMGSTKAWGSCLSPSESGRASTALPREVWWIRHRTCPGPSL
jgi:hypothetical protein